MLRFENSTIEAGKTGAKSRFRRILTTQTHGRHCLIRADRAKFARFDP